MPHAPTMHTARLTELCIPKQWKPLPQTKMTADGYPVYGANGLKGYYNEYNHEQPVIAIASRGCGCGAVYLTPPKSYVTANALCLEALSPRILPEYLYYYLKNYDFSPIITGAALPQITTQGLRDVSVRFGPPEQQQRIVHTLQQCDKLLSKHNERLQQLQLLKAAHYTHLQAQYHSHPDFCYVPLSSVAGIECGKRDAGEATADGPYPFFTCAKHPQRINCYDFDCECVLISGNIDFKVQYFCGKFSAYQRTYILQTQNTRKLSVRFLFSYLNNTPQLLESLCIGTSIKYLKKKDLQQIPIWLPPIDIQNSIADCMQHTDAAICQAQRAMEQTKLLMRKLMQDFWGTELRLEPIK